MPVVLALVLFFTFSEDCSSILGERDQASPEELYFHVPKTLFTNISRLAGATSDFAPYLSLWSEEQLLPCENSIIKQLVSDDVLNVSDLEGAHKCFTTSRSTIPSSPYSSETKDHSKGVWEFLHARMFLPIMGFLQILLGITWLWYHLQLLLGSIWFPMMLSTSEISVASVPLNFEA
jgi:hypothetical protein